MIPRIIKDIYSNFELMDTTFISEIAALFVFFYDVAKLCTILLP